MKSHLSSLKKNGLSTLKALYHLCALLFIMFALHDLIVYTIGIGKIYWFNW